VTTQATRVDVILNAIGIPTVVEERHLVRWDWTEGGESTLC
jgi:hypothetical protein